MTKDVKALLKQAKEHLKEKEYVIAVKACKKILKEEKGNYNALVLMAAAMREVEEYKLQVPNTLKKAVHVQPDNPLAWHGLLVYYESQPDNADIWIELVPIYCKILQLDR